jgi:hypothetical protein
MSAVVPSICTAVPITYAVVASISAVVASISAAVLMTSAAVAISSPMVSIVSTVGGDCLYRWWRLSLPLVAIVSAVVALLSNLITDYVRRGTDYPLCCDPAMASFCACSRLLLLILAVLLPYLPLLRAIKLYAEALGRGAPVRDYVSREEALRHPSGDLPGDDALSITLDRQIAWLEGTLSPEQEAVRLLEGRLL